MFKGKTPVDVFNLSVNMFGKLSYLTLGRQISPSEVYAQLVRAVHDVESILRNIDPKCRYNIISPLSDPNLKPKDAFVQCLKVRESIGIIRDFFKLGSIKIPDYSKQTSIKPNDVYLQTQIIIAELNLLKLGTNTRDSTPLPNVLPGKTPSDVHEQGVYLDHLLRQIKEVNQLYSQI